MSERKRKGKRAAQPPPSKEHSPDQVKQVALMLYAQRPLTLSSLDALNEQRWDSLVREALDLLDNLDKACARVGESGRKGRVQYRKAEKELPLNASGNVPYDKAVMDITREKYRKVKHAKDKFEMVVLGWARERGAATEREMRAQLKDWAKNGMPLNQVLSRRSLWTEREYRHYREATAGTAKKRRAPWSKKARKAHEKAESQRKKRSQFQKS